MQRSKTNLANGGDAEAGIAMYCVPSLEMYQENTKDGHTVWVPSQIKTEAE